MDLTLQKFHRLLVMGVNSRGHSIFWSCLCDCGNPTLATTSQLIRGDKKSCGCLRKEKTAQLRSISGGNTLEKGKSHFNKLFYQYRKDAEKRGLEFSLSKEEFKNLIDQNCHYCDACPDTGFVEKARNGNYLHNGIDRKANSLGYVVSNCLPCCSRCNRMKMGMDYHDFLAQCGVIYLTRKLRDTN